MINRRRHAKIWATALPVAALCHITTAADAQELRTVYLYNSAIGTAQASVNDATYAPWGNGEASNDRRMDYEGAPVLRATTRNFQEGIRFDLKNPLNLDAYKANGFLRLRVRFRGGGFGGGGFGGGMPGMGGPGMGMPGMMPPGMGGTDGNPFGRTDGDEEGGGGFGGRPSGFGGGGFGGGGFGGRGGRDGGDFGRFVTPTATTSQFKPRWTSNAQVPPPLPNFGAQPGMMPPGMMPPGMMQPGITPGGIDGMGGMTPARQTTAITQFSVTMFRENGTTAGTVPIDLSKSEADETGWHLFAIPLKDFTSTANAAGPVTRVVLTSDKEDSFYLAQAAIVIENGQMTASIRRPSDQAGAQIAEVEVKPGAVTLIADVEAGAADPVVEWNFDADNVGNLPPGALSNPMGAGGMMGMEGAEGGMPGMMPPGMLSPGGRMPLTPGTGMTPGGPAGMGGMTPGMGGMTAQLGPRIDSRGLTATFDYPNEEQNYRVEITVRDRSGKKEPVTASILIRVRA